MNIEKELDSIIEKYNMQIDLFDFIKQDVKQFLKAHCENKKVGLMCAGEHTLHMLEDFGNVLDIVCIFDNDREKIETKMGQTPICSIEEWGNVDIIIISTFNYREEVKQQLVRKGVPQEKIVDVYDYFEGYGLLSCIYFYPSMYQPLIFMNNQYKKAELPADKARWLLDLIKGYLNIRDICSAIKYIEEYVAHSYVDTEKMINLKKELDGLTVKITAELHARTQRDIIWFWQDALCHDWVKYMPFYKDECINQGLYFTNGYSAPNSTRMVYEMIFHKRYEIDDCAFKEDENAVCYWLEELRGQGYDCVRVTCSATDWIHKLETFDYRGEALMPAEAMVGQMYWRAIDYVINSENPVFILIHTGLETHPPFCAPNLEEFDANLTEYRQRFLSDITDKITPYIQNACLYMNDVTKYYSDLLGRNAVKLYMSDHGNTLRKKSRRWGREGSHINFIVTGDKIAARKCDGLFSFYNFDKVIYYILQPDETKLKDIFKEEILFQSMDAYNKGFIESFIQGGYAEFIVSFRGIRTKVDQYVLMRTGKEFYYRLPDEETNYINDPQYQDRIDELREKAGNNFIDINHEEKFKDTHILYDYLEQQKG